MSDADDQKISPRAFDRERQARKEAERLLEEKSRELVLANRELERFNAELELRVDERTEELARALELAEEASRAKTRFLAVMSHEFRTPLTSILGYTELLREAELSEQERANFLAVVHRGGDHLLGMMTRVLEIADLDEPSTAGDRRPVDLPALLEELLGRFGPDVEDRDLVMVLRGEGPTPRTIETVPHPLRAALLGVIENAIRFTERGQIEIHVIFVPEDADADADADVAGGDGDSPEVRTRRLPGRLRCRVTDSGIGIAAEDHARIFEPFEQVDAGMDRRWDGPGLGLTIARRAARALGGDIQLDSDLGQGATFVIDVPVEVSPTGGWLKLGQGMPLPRRGPRDAAAGRPIEGLRVMLAEDQAEIRWLVRRVLERAGATVLEAVDGRELITQVEAEEIDLVVTDLQMPNMDGYTAIRHLRGAGFDRPVIALTVHAVNADMHEARVAGCDDSLTKPVDPVRLVDACVRWQGRRHVLDADSATAAPRDAASDDRPDGPAETSGPSGSSSSSSSGDGAGDGDRPTESGSDG